MPVIWFVALVVVAGITLIEGVFIIAILRLVGQLHVQIEKLSQASDSPSSARAPLREIPDGEFTSVTGEEFTLSSLWQRKQTLLLFMSAGCPACVEMLRQVSTLMRDTRSADMAACVLYAGHPDRVRDVTASLALPSNVKVAAVEVERLAREYAIAKPPTVVAIDAPGQIREVIVGPTDNQRLRGLLFSSPSVSAAHV